MDQFNFPKIEEQILKFWKEKRIFEKSLKKRKGKKRFVFFDGPPTANGRPGIHHILARAFKDVFCRYKTMRGFLVERKAGWDTHGLPVELEVEKKLGIKSKPEIEKYGIAPFNKKCKESVWEYKDEWEKMTERTAYWVDTKNPYVTYDNNYIESLWWIISEINKKKLLYQGHKIVPYCARCGTAVSSHEVAQGYKKVKDPSVYVKFSITHAYRQAGHAYRQAGNFQFSKSHSERSEESQKIPKQVRDDKISFLVWTTTPWTLPANTALAVGSDIDYVQIRAAKDYDPNQVGDPNFDTADTLILAKARLSVIKGPYHIEKEFKGKDLIGLEYEPLYAFGSEVCELEKATLEKPCCFLVVPADFVSTEDGTGIVHIAPAFGEDDMQTAQKHGLNTLITIDEQGKFKKEITPWAGMFVKDADPLIIGDLKNKNILYKAEKYEHDYPFCWRCQTPLIYYAKKTWFVKMSQLKDKLIAANKKVNWVPAHLRDGRFGEWLKDMKDWAFSRERYWGTPLPIWICQNCGNQKVISGINELSQNQIPKNRYFFMRHAEAEHNCKKIVSSWPETKGFKLTKKGKEQIQKSAARLLKELRKNGNSEKIDVIFASDLMRTKETAEEMAKILGVKKIILDSRLRDVDFGSFNEKTIKEYHSFFKSKKDRFENRPPSGENWNDAKERMFEFLRKIDERLENKNILVVSHGDPLWLLDGATRNLDSGKQLKLKYPKVGDLWPIKYTAMPMDEKGRLDLHRPYIDKIELKCQKCKSVRQLADGRTGIMKRIPEVADVWFDSGAMPFAQWHWPFENKARIGPPGRAVRTGRKISFPADFIAEGIDQTRGWFYTLLAVSTALGKGAPYKNVISNGHVLDKAGQKMSKSKGNVVNPWEMIDKYGSDVVRWYFYTVNSVGESKLFDEKDLQDRQRNFVMTIINILNFYKLYAGKNSELKVKSLKLKARSENVLDRWILARLNVLIDEVNKNLDAFDATTASRAITDFIDDLSNWYVRRSRARFRDENSEDYKMASATLKYVLISLSKLIAPFTPFLAEYVFHNLEGHEGSVHLENYPKADKKSIDKKLIEQMESVRNIVAMGLKLRAQNQLKVRQPLAELRIKNQACPTGSFRRESRIKEELIDLMREELNIKKIFAVKEIREEAGWKVAEEGGLKIALDIRLNDELRMEGAMRDIVRNIQEMRKDAGLTPNDIISLYYDHAYRQAGGNDDILRIFDKFSGEIKETVLAEKLYGGRKENETFKIEREFEVEIFGNKEKIWIAFKAS